MGMLTSHDVINDPRYKGMMELFQIPDLPFKKLNIFCEDVNDFAFVIRGEWIVFHPATKFFPKSDQEVEIKTDDWVLVSKAEYERLKKFKEEHTDEEATTG